MQIAQQNVQQQAQVQQQSAQQAAQMKQQEVQMKGQIESQMAQMKHQFDIEKMALEHQMRREIEMIRAQATLGFKTDDKEFKEKIEVLKEDRKDDRVKKQAIEQSKLMSQRKDRRGELEPTPEDQMNATITQLLGE